MNFQHTATLLALRRVNSSIPRLSTQTLAYLREEIHIIRYVPTDLGRRVGTCAHVYRSCTRIVLRMAAKSLFPPRRIMEYHESASERRKLEVPRMADRYSPCQPIALRISRPSRYQKQQRDRSPWPLGLFWSPECRNNSASISVAVSQMKPHQIIWKYLEG